MYFPTKQEAFDMYRELYNQKQKNKKYTVKLPCGHVDIEVTDKSDRYFKCFKCGKKYLMTHNARNNRFYAE